MKPKINYIKIRATNIRIIVVENIFLLDVNSKSTIDDVKNGYKKKIKNKKMDEFSYQRLQRK